MRKLSSIIIEFLLIILFFNPLSVSASMLQWGPTTEGVSGYRLYYGTSQGNYTNSKDVGLAIEYSLSNLPLVENSTYYFVVRAYNSAGESDDSNEISWTVPDSTPPSIPTGLTYDNENVTLNWTANSESDLAEYRVY